MEPAELFDIWDDARLDPQAEEERSNELLDHLSGLNKQALQNNIVMAIHKYDLVSEGYTSQMVMDLMKTDQMLVQELDKLKIQAKEMVKSLKTAKKGFTMSTRPLTWSLIPKLYDTTVVHTLRASMSKKRKTYGKMFTIMNSIRDLVTLALETLKEKLAKQPSVMIHDVAEYKLAIQAGFKGLFILSSKLNRYASEAIEQDADNHGLEVKLMPSMERLNKKRVLDNIAAAGSAGKKKKMREATTFLLT